MRSACDAKRSTIGWKFSLFEGDASTADFDISGWTDVSIPHTWNAKDADDEIPVIPGKRLVQKSGDSEELIPEQRVYLSLREPIKKRMCL